MPLPPLSYNLFVGQAELCFCFRDDGLLLPPLTFPLPPRYLTSQASGVGSVTLNAGLSFLPCFSFFSQEVPLDHARA